MNWDNVIEFISNIYFFLKTFNPSPTFLSNIAAIDAVIIAIAIPLSLEIVSKISERYQSEIISKKFFQSCTVTLLPKLLVLNIIVAISLIFFIKENPSFMLWKSLAWITFILFLFIVLFFTFVFIPRVMRYMRDTKFILKELFNDTEKFFK
jgi:hypothetical protein